MDLLQHGVETPEFIGAIVLVGDASLVSQIGMEREKA
jgi:hypothetical protein